MTADCVGIRREDKNKWEARVPLVPDDVRRLTREAGLQIRVQPSGIRTIGDDDYIEAGAVVDEDLSPCQTVLAVKEIPEAFFQPGRTYVFFSHVIKGQSYNMAMLRRLMAQGCQLVDYEKINDGDGRRLIFFGRFAGIAGMTDTLWALGRRLRWEGTPNPFEAVRLTHQYRDLEDVRQSLATVAEQIRGGGLPSSLRPLVVGFAGYGHVSRGAQEIFDILPVQSITPAQLTAGEWEGRLDPHTLFKVEFREEDMVVPVEADAVFELQDYYDHPERYRSRFTDYLPGLTVLVNCIYWDTPYPRLVTKEYIRDVFGSGTTPRLRVIGDISCDIEGAVECTVKATDPGDPVFVYDPAGDRAVMGVEGGGPVIMAVDNLPCELPLDASREFSEALAPFVGPIAGADYTVPFEQCDLPDPVKNAVIVYQGRLTPDYRYLERYL